MEVPLQNAPIMQIHFPVFGTSTTFSVPEIFESDQVTIPSQISTRLFLNEVLSESDLEGSPLCKGAMIILRRLSEEGGAGLTKSGAFNRRFVVWAVDHLQWPRYTAEELYRINKTLNEDDVPPLAYLHELLRTAQLVRHVKGKAILTKAGKSLIDDDGRVQAVLFETFFTRFDFAKFERSPIELPDADPFHFLGVIRNRLGGWVEYPQFASWCLPIDALTPQRGTPEEDAYFYLALRLVRPLVWLGLLEQKTASPLSPIHLMKLRKTALFDKFLRFELPLSNSATLH